MYVCMYKVYVCMYVCMYNVYVCMYVQGVCMYKVSYADLVLLKYMLAKSPF